MSVTTSSANIDPPPLLFARELSPTPPSLSQSQLSRLSPRHTSQPMPTEDTEDIDISMPTTLPQGQNHDREDSDMSGTEDDDQIAQQNLPQPPVDAMDTTSDNLHAQARLEAAAIMAELAGTAAMPPPPPPAIHPNDPSTWGPPSSAPYTGGTLVRVTSNGSTIDSSGENLEDYQPPRPPLGATEPDPPADDDSGGSDSSSDDEGGTGYRWYPIEEDTSVPDEAELREIEKNEDVSALEHDHWEAKTFEDLEDPEYTPGATGRIEWKIQYNGTRENPHKELLRKSHIVNIGGYDWQIKFYPRGNDSDYLSIYVECVSVVDDKKDKEGGQDKQEDARKDSHSEQEPAAAENEQKGILTESLTPTTHLRPPIPLLCKPPPPRRSVAAQVSVVLYSPSEPRVGYFRDALHRFCPGSPDWGWTRFHGPYFEIHRRQRGQRQALLRNDELAFTAYIRIIEDETGCLGEHHSTDNPWDSFAMTGLQGMKCSGGYCRPDGNLISAISTWMLLRPFRELLYKAKAPNLLLPDEARQKPKPLTAALQEILYLLRTRIKSGQSAVDLAVVLTALQWYGIYDDLGQMDLVQIWEVLRTRLEQEWVGTPLEGSLSELFGTATNRMTGLPSYRVSVKDSKNVQGAIDAVECTLVVPGETPCVLNIELERQIFDQGTRSWKKLTNEIILDELISVNGAQYTLFGMVIHTGDLQSDLYHSILRPQGPESRWYTYKDSRGENRVECLTQRDVREAQRTSDFADKSKGSSVVYMTTYIRSNVLSEQFALPDDEEWDVPLWLLALHDEQAVESRDVANPCKFSPAAKTEEMIEFEFIDSGAFESWQGPGYIDLYSDSAWKSCNKYVVSLPSSLQRNDPEVLARIAHPVPGVKDPRQCMLWFLDTWWCHGKSALRPTFGWGLHCHVDLSGRGSAVSSLKKDYPARWCWLHVLPLEHLSNQPTTALKTPGEPDMAEEAPPEADGTNQAADQDDTVMSDSGEFNEPQDALFPGEHELIAEAMRRNDAANAAVIAAAEELVASGHPPVDTEMADTAVTAPAPPLVAPVSISKPASSTAPPEPHVYFFLKVFDGSLRARGSHVARCDERVDKAISRILQLEGESEHKMELYEEKSLVTLSPLRRRKTFAAQGLVDGAIVIVSFPASEEAKEAALTRGEILDLPTYLKAHSDARNYPHLLAGTFRLNYFSSDYYHGEMRHRLPHGHGRRIYHNGDVYEGAFCLSQRHGHGKLTYRSGDTYVGSFAHDLRHGHGTFTDAATGNVYEGNWKRDRRFGKGVTRWEKAEAEESVCKVCWEEPLEAVFWDCGHMVACLSCARLMENCSVCRRAVRGVVKLYVA